MYVRFFVLKLLAGIFMSFMLFNNINMDNFCDVVGKSYQIQTIYNGETRIYSKNDDLFKDIIGEMLSIFEESREMPSLGVSLDNLTREEMKNGIWIQLDFEDEIVYSGMPFDSLLFKLENNSSGLSVIRKYQGLYEGRCYYFDLSGNYNQLIEVIVNRCL